MTKKPKVGRPPFPEGTAKEGRLFCRLLKTEIAEITQAAKAAGQTRSEFIRATLLDAARGKIGSAPLDISEPVANPPKPQDAGQQPLISQESGQGFID